MGLRAAFFIVRRRMVASCARWRVNSLLSTIGYSAYRLVFGPSTADLFGLGDDDEDLLFVHEARLSGQFARQWGLRIMAQGGALKEATNSELRHLLAYDRSLFCADA